MNIKLEVTARVLRIIQEKLEKELPENLPETETYEQAIGVVNNMWTS
jgi:hypothetical protein